MTDYILWISFDPDFEEIVHGRLFLTRSIGNDSSHDGVIAAYFDTADDRDSAAELLRDLPVALRSDERERTDLLQLYQQSLQPLFVGHLLVIAPQASLIPNDTQRHRLVIPQEMAFGTGGHESTALAIELLEELDLQERRGLDIGSGSGILALAMLRLGASKVVAFDVDLDAFRPLRENRARNATPAAKMPLFIGTIDALRGGVFDVVTMNILPEVIVPLLPLVIRHVGRTLILSGILSTLRSEILRACAGMQLVREREKGEWWAGTFTA